MTRAPPSRRPAGASATEPQRQASGRPTPTRPPARIACPSPPPTRTETPRPPRARRRRAGRRCGGRRPVARSRDGRAGRPRETRDPPAKLSRNRIRPATEGGVLTTRARPHAGATLTFDASEPGRLVLTLDRCRPKRKRKPSRCRTAAAAASKEVKAGRVIVHLTGRAAGRRALPRGRYRLRLVLTDAAGNASTPATLVFTTIGRWTRTRTDAHRDLSYARRR